MTTTQTQGSSAVQGALWSAAAEEWASLMEPQGRALFEAVLSCGPFRPGARVLEVGCGSGLFAKLIAARGCEVLGLDASEALLGVARRRSPTVPFHQGDLEALPFPGEHFDIVTGMNSFQYAADPQHALTEARRVTKAGGHVVVATWGPAQACEAASYLAALKQLLPPPPPGASGPFGLSEETALIALVTSAGLTPQSINDVDVTWSFENLDEALTAMLAAGPAILAIQTSGLGAVRTTVQRAIAPYQLANGAYRLENRFRYLMAVRDRTK